MKKDNPQTTHIFFSRAAFQRHKLFLQPKAFRKALISDMLKVALYGQRLTHTQKLSIQNYLQHFLLKAQFSPSAPPFDKIPRTRAGRRERWLDHAHGHGRWGDHALGHGRWVERAPGQGRWPDRAPMSRTFEKEVWEVVGSEFEELSKLEPVPERAVGGFVRSRPWVSTELGK